MSHWFQTYGFADIIDNLLVGAYPLDARDVSVLAGMRVGRILNLVGDSEYRDGEREAVETALQGSGITERRLNFTDFGNLPADVLETAVGTVSEWLDEGARVYVHCRAGWQRSAAIAAGVVATRYGIEIERALDYVQARKPSADPLPHQREDLKRWWSSRAVSSP